MRHRVVAAILILVAFLSLAPQPAQAQIPVTDVAHILETVWAEFSRYAQELLSLYNQAEQIYAQYEAIYYQVVALQKLDFHSWRDIAPLLGRMESLLADSQLLTYRVQELETQFWSFFPLGTYTNAPEERYQQVYKILDTYRAQLQVLQDIDEDTRLAVGHLADMKAQLAAAEGPEQALEVIGDAQLWTGEQILAGQSVLQLLLNQQIVTSAQALQERANEKDSSSQALRSTLSAARDAASLDAPAYTPVPSWMDQ